MAVTRSSTNYEVIEMMDKLTDIRDTVALERKKRLKGSATKTMVSTFHSGQENAKSKKAKDPVYSGGFGSKKW